MADSSTNITLSCEDAKIIYAALCEAPNFPLDFTDRFRDSYSLCSYLKEIIMENKKIKPIKFKFTPGESVIIEHRLGVPDALAECLELNYEYVHDVCLKFEKQLKKGYLEYETHYEKIIFEDCIEGSTVFGNHESMTSAQKAALNRMTNSIEKKTRIHFPNF